LINPEVDMCAMVPNHPIAHREDPPAPGFVCSWTNGGADAAWVHLAGNLCLATLPQLVQVLSEAELQVRLVVLDLRKVEQIDDAAVHAIVNAGIRARLSGGRLVLVRGPGHVDQAFAATFAAGGRPLIGTSEAVEIGEPPPAQPTLHRK
jgi:anti-anti-sigma regulatory factor